VTEQEKIETFRLELDYIQNPDIKKFTEGMIGRLPDYFFEVGASSTGRYHPSYALGDGGLVRHTQAAARIAIELFRCEAVTGKFSDDTKDTILSALILHDGCKHGIVKQQYTVAEHPLEVVKFCEQQEDVKVSLSEDLFEKIMDGIKTHMGFFNTDFKTKREVLPKPDKGYQNFIHLCDYLASRKCLEFNFDVALSK
jgi:hypothetical protein